MDKSTLQGMWTKILENPGTFEKEVSRAGRLIGTADIYPPPVGWWTLGGGAEGAETKEKVDL